MKRKLIIPILQKGNTEDLFFLFFLDLVFFQNINKQKTCFHMRISPRPGDGVGDVLDLMPK